MAYLINKWALIRRGELSVTPDTVETHPDFLRTISREDFETAFRQVGEIFYRIITDISETPERFGMPLYDESTTRYGAPEANESRHAAWRPMKLLYSVLTQGKKVKNSKQLFKALRDYGFEFKETLEFPDNPNVITVMNLVANVGIEEMFCKWSFRLLSKLDNYCDPFYALHDKTHTNEERAFISAFHQTMLKMGYFYSNGSWNEGPGICYYDKESVMERKGPYIYRIIDWMGDLRLMLRIRNAEKCLDLFTDEEIIEMLRHSDPGCNVHVSGNCNKGVGYIFEGQSRWHCGCCGAPFWLRPKTENIGHYIKLVEIGEKR